MKYRLLAMDLDKTLIGPDGNIPNEVASRLRELTSKGVRLALCTGRVTPAAEHYAGLLGGASVAAFNGAVVRPENGTVTRKELPESVVKKVVDICCSMNLYVQFYNGDRIVVDRFTAELGTDLDVNFTEALEVGDLTKAKITPSPKLVAVELSDRVEMLAEQLRKEFPDLNVTQSSGFVLEIMPNGISKASGLESICDHFGIKREETVAVGDSMNDESMVKWAGMGVAVGNADPRLKAVADYVTEKEMSFGVLETIEKFFS